MTTTQHAMYRQYQCEYRFLRERDGVVVEPHWLVAQRMLALDLDYEAQFTLCATDRFRRRRHHHPCPRRSPLAFF